LPREFWPPEHVHAAGYPYAESPLYAGSPSPPVTRAWGNGHGDAHGRVNGRPGPGYPPGGGRVAPGYPNGRGNPGYPPAGGPAYNGAHNGAYSEAYAGPQVLTRPPGPGYPPGSVTGRPGYGTVPGPGPGTGPNPVAAPAARPADGQRASRYPLLIGPDTGVPDQVIEGRRVLGWRRLVLLPRPPAFLRPDQPLREHRDVSGGWLRPAVFGAMDGLVTNSSLIAGIGGGGGGHGAIVLTGIAGLIAGAFSMATGEYISVTSQNELTAAEVELERMQHHRDPAGKQDRLAEIFMDKGVSPNLAEAVARQISADQGRAVAAHVREELGIDPDDLPSPRTAAGASFAAFTVGALIPLSPFLAGYPVLGLALALAGIAAILGGAAVAKLTDRSMLAGGLRQFTAAFLATGVAFAVGHLVGGVVS
jgi:VIT1/CCC1 family predicted Fe2+/Mn2+ transporter